MKNKETRLRRASVFSFFILHSSFSRLQNWHEWEPNPVVVKELRQAMRSQILTGMLLLLLVMLFLASVASLTGQSLFKARATEMGQGMFDACLVVLAITGLVFVPLYTGIRLALERQRSDLMFVTPLPVAKLVHGKLLSGLCVAGLFFSVSVPFMTFSSLLRGLDLVTIQFVLLLLFGAIGVAILAAMAVAVLPLPMILKTIFGLAFTAGLILVCGGLLLFFFGVVKSGAATLLHSSMFWDGFMVIVGMAAFGVMISYGLAISFIAKHRRPGDPYTYSFKPQPSHD